MPRPRLESYPTYAKAAMSARYRSQSDHKPMYVYYFRKKKGHDYRIREDGLEHHSKNYRWMATFDNGLME